MAFVPFHDYFPQLAEAETRSMTTVPGGPIPEDTYGLLELYCDERGCDCRRVYFTVLSHRRQQVEAVISFGWESRDFYASWGHGPSTPAAITEMKGPVLNRLSPQGKFAPELLELIDQVVLRDPAYVAMLRRHYRMFREAIEHQQAPHPRQTAATGSQPLNRAERRRRGQRGRG